MRFVCGSALLFFLVLAFGQSSSLDAQTKKKTTVPSAAVLQFDAKVVKLDEKKGLPTKIFYQTSEEDQKKLGIGQADTPITKNTKFVFIGPDGEKNYTAKSAYADPAIKAHLNPDKLVRLQLTAQEVEVLRFGPDLKPQGPKRGR